MRPTASREETVLLMFAGGAGVKVEKRAEQAAGQPLGPEPSPPRAPHSPSADRSHLCRLSSPNTAQCSAPGSCPDGDLRHTEPGADFSGALSLVAPRGLSAVHGPPHVSWWRVPSPSNSGGARTRVPEGHLALLGRLPDGGVFNGGGVLGPLRSRW